MTRNTGLQHPLLDRAGVSHGFGTRESAPPGDTFRPKQVHGVDVYCLSSALPDSVTSPTVDVEADAVCCVIPGQSVAVVTADCIPILACSESGSAVLALHAGWRGLAAGVVQAGIETLRAHASPGETLFAVIGPHIGGCCYEVDAPVLDAMVDRFGASAVERASTPTRRGHARLSIASLAIVDLDRNGVGAACRGTLPQSCTHCEAERFYSYRRDGERAGRMAHFIATPYQ